tara:strand:- start:1060 stop:2070 length:1011 start_codon:yes stop_codon:yes gene_type:complete
MIKVHCFVSCVCEVIKRTPGVDHRPFYFGVWDADFAVSPQYVLSYHSEHTRHELFRTWYHQLYGIEICQWYDHSRSKTENIDHLLRLMAERPPGRNIMVMLDMYWLPERENKFNQNPFPHYVMLETTEDPGTWFMYDPDFRWEGPLPREQILAAIAQPTVAGGYFFDDVDICHSTSDTVAAYFSTCMKLNQNPFNAAIRAVVHAHLEQTLELPLAHLETALREIPVLAIRKYAYEHGFAFFCHALGYSEAAFEHWCDEIEKLVKTYTLVHYRALKLARTGDPALAEEVFGLLDAQDVIEFRLKRDLQNLFEQWRPGSAGTTAIATIGDRSPAREGA